MGYQLFQDFDPKEIVITGTKVLDSQGGEGGNGTMYFLGRKDGSQLKFKVKDIPSKFGVNIYLNKWSFELALGSSNSASEESVAITQKLKDIKDHILLYHTQHPEFAPKVKGKVPSVEDIERSGDFSFGLKEREHEKTSTTYYGMRLKLHADGDKFKQPGIAPGGSGLALFIDKNGNALSNNVADFATSAPPQHYYTAIVQLSHIYIPKGTSVKYFITYKLVSALKGDPLRFDPITPKAAFDLDYTATSDEAKVDLSEFE